ncbi:PREDICTED: uncharacterized protein LOC105570737, partial [Vollenhovia emeryi]|uniref:uncharacterized protein LOC105570737 n=1 Tax=Vollenhovia emeryi TaxID=411798 RepID=UPI0005F4B14C
MGIRAAYKADLQATPAELVYGETLRLPGEFLQETPQETSSLSDFILQLKKAMRDLRPQPVKRHGTPAVFEHKDLPNSTHVFLRHDAPKASLQPSYDGPYDVLSRTDKYYKLRINGKTVHVTVDRIKPAYMLADQDEPKATPVTPVPKNSTTGTPASEELVTTRSGRTSKKTVRFQAPAFKQRRG